MPIAHHIIAVFADRHKADLALTELNERGFKHDEISVMARDVESEAEVRLYSAAVLEKEVSGPESHTVVDPKQNQYIKQSHDVTIKDPSAMKSSALTGTIIGAGVGLTSILIPGIGPIAAGGALAAALANMASFTALGTSLGALVGIFGDVEIPEEREVLYKTAFDNGEFFIMVQVNYDPSMRIEEARAILKRYQPRLYDEFDLS